MYLIHHIHMYLHMHVLRDLLLCVCVCQEVDGEEGEGAEKETEEEEEEVFCLPLESLGLGGNKIGDTGAQHLASGLTSNTSQSCDHHMTYTPSQIIHLCSSLYPPHTYTDIDTKLCRAIFCLSPSLMQDC